jgi:hypothetical protein
MKQTFCLTLLLVTCLFAFSQPTTGTTGLLNVPTAEMQRDGTFMFGGNYLPEAIMPTPLDYNSGNYYLNITFMPFLEINYRCTFIKVKNGKFNQDRSFAIRERVQREKKYIPAVVIGANDIYTSSLEKGNQYFGAMYVVTSKNFVWNKNWIETSVGYGFETFRNSQIIGLFGGMAFSPSCLKSLRLMTEYDTKVVNAGGSITLFNHLQIAVFAYDLRLLVGGLAYKIYL